MKRLILASTIAAVMLGWVPIATAASVVCAREGEFCNAPAGVTVYYGRSGLTRQRVSPSGGLACNNDVFGGDPQPGSKKVCYYNVRQECSSLNEPGCVCNLTANGRVCEKF